MRSLETLSVSFAEYSSVASREAFLERVAKNLLLMATSWEEVVLTGIMQDDENVIRHFRLESEFRARRIRAARFINFREYFPFFAILE